MLPPFMNMAYVFLVFHDVTAALLVPLNNPLGIKFCSYANFLFCLGWKTWQLATWVKTNNRGFQNVEKQGGLKFPKKLTMLWRWRRLWQRANARNACFFVAFSWWLFGICHLVWWEITFIFHSATVSTGAACMSNKAKVRGGGIGPWMFQGFFVKENNVKTKE